MALTLSNVTPPTATTLNIGGTTGRIYLAAITDFLTIGVKEEMNDPAATNSGIIEITDDHTFTSPKGFRTIYITRDSGNLEGKPNSERDTTGYLATYKGQTPGADAATASQLLQWQNIKAIVLIELADGRLRQLGSARFPAEVKTEWNSGNNEKGYRGWTITISSFESSEAEYKGIITLATP